MSSQDLEYFRTRAATERALASTAERADVAAIHEELARQYEALIEKEALRPPPGLAEPFRRIAGIALRP